MDYQKAKDIRGKSLSSLITDKIVRGEGIMSAVNQSLSEKSKARAKGFKESFDPLNIVKKLTGGSRLAPAILGRLSGRSAEDIKYFAGDPKKKKQLAGGSEDLSSAIQTLGSIYSLMVEMQEEKKLMEEELLRKQKTEQELEDTRNKELIKALTGRRKTPKEKRKEEVKEKTEQRKEKAESKKEEKKKEQTEKKTEQKQDKVERKKETEVKKEDKAKKDTAKKIEEVKKEEIKKPEVVKPKEVKPQPTAKPTVAPAPKAPTPGVSTAAKIAIAAASATGVFSSSDAFSKTMYPYAEKASKGLGGKIPPVAILGQWSGESGGGKNLPADFNYAGIKAGKNDKKGDYVLTEERYTDAQIKQAEASGETLHKVLGQNDKIRKKGRDVTIDEWFGKGSYDKALSEGKKWVQVKSYFAKFDDFDDFTNRYISFLSSPRYAKARASTTPAEFGSEVAKAGYATASADKYSAKVASFADSFNNSGNQISAASTENRELKKDMTDSAPATTIVNNNTTTQTKKQTPTPAAGGDDRSAYAKKVN